MKLNKRASEVLHRASTLSKQRRIEYSSSNENSGNNNENPGKQTSLIRAKSMRKRTNTSGRTPVNMSFNTRPNPNRQSVISGNSGYSNSSRSKGNSRSGNSNDDGRAIKKQ